jgi:hypothetical protein
MSVFHTHHQLSGKRVACYIDFKACCFSPLNAATYLLLVSGLAYITNCVGSLTYPKILYQLSPLIFIGGIALGAIALVLYSRQNKCIWAAATDIFKGRYSLGLLIQDSSIIAVHAAICYSFYARCKTGSCEDEDIPFCNPEHEADGFPRGHAHLLLMLPLITHLLLTAKSFGGMLLCWVMSVGAMVYCMLAFGLTDGSHYYIGYAGVTLFAICKSEILSYER